MAHSCILLRTNLLKRIGGYWSVPLIDDWDMMIRMGEVSRLANIDEVLHHYRVHLGSLNGNGMRRMRLSIDYARERARRRQRGEPEIGHEAFIAERNARPLLARAAEAVDLHSRCQYRLALAELYGGRAVRGYMRMGWAALLAPRLTFQRLGRIWQERSARSRESARRGFHA